METIISAYSTLPLHGITAIPGKISGALLVIDAIEDAVPLIHGPIGCAFQRKINPFKPYSPFYETPCTNMNDVDVVYGGEDKLSQGNDRGFYWKNKACWISRHALCDYRSDVVQWYGEGRNG
jgi:nitrogenase molybdenum-iron protein alpha/beta subunit